MVAWNLAVLSDDAPGEGFAEEHGFSLWLEGPGGPFLFDTGASGLFARNAAALGIDLSRAKAILLSHGHYDHTGGLHEALDACPGAKVFLHPLALKPRWRRLPRPPHKPIGMPENSKKHLEASRVELTGSAVELAPGVLLSGVISRGQGGEPGGPLFSDSDCLKPDGFEDEQFLLVKGSDGWALVSGCGHLGIPNLLHHASLLTRGEPVAALLGGFHLQGAAPPLLASALRALAKHGTRRLYPGHCTGAGAVRYLRKSFRGEVRPLRVGMTPTLP